MRSIKTLAIILATSLLALTSCQDGMGSTYILCVDSEDTVTVTFPSNSGNSFYVAQWDTATNQQTVLETKERSFVVVGNARISAPYSYHMHSFEKDVYCTIERVSNNGTVKAMLVGDFKFSNAIGDAEWPVEDETVNNTVFEQIAAKCNKVLEMPVGKKKIKVVGED